jgi:AcrR family transcriptional regulator
VENEDMEIKKAKPRKRLTRDKILDAAVAIADADGLESLSMRKIAAKLQVEAMSLYNHIKNKDEILDGIVERIGVEFSAPDTSGNWRKNMSQRAISAHEVLLKHPWATMLIVSRINLGPIMLRYVDATIGCLRGAGFSYQMADYAWNAIDSHIYGFTLQELNFPIPDDSYASTAEDHLDLIPAEQFPHLNGMARLVIDGQHDGQSNFEFGLDLILDGLERKLKAE